jgi:hypothetical protein
MGYKQARDKQLKHLSEFGVRDSHGCIFWDVTPCSGYQSLGRTCCRSLHDGHIICTLKMEASDSSETSQTTAILIVVYLMMHESV